MRENERNIYLEDIPIDEAQKRLRRALQDVGRWDPVPGEKVCLSNACGRITSEPVWARLSCPHYYAAAMDGYAVRADHTVGATETQPLVLRHGREAHPVNTGDPLPTGCNAVIMIEHVQRLEGNRIQIGSPLAPWQHVRMMGEDIVSTEMLLPANHRIRPVDVGAIAGCGHTEVWVRRCPKVILIPTGSEMVAVGETPGPGQIIEYNSLVMRAQVLESGGEPTVMDTVPDHPEKLRASLEAALSRKPDLVLVLSGTSAGSKDYAASIVHELGTLLVHGIAVRPGHPVIIGLANEIPVIGVPGYPVSAALTGEFIIQPLLSHWLGQPPASDSLPRLQAVLTSKVLSPTGDDDFVRVTLAEVSDRVMATPLKRGAGVLTSLVRADGLVRIPRFSEGLDMGQETQVLLYRTMDMIRKRVLVMGSHDPMLDLLGQQVAEQFPQTSLASANVGSMGGLFCLRRRSSHLASVHLLDEKSGEYNVPYLKKYLPGMPMQLITFAHREQGLIVPHNNPKAIKTIEDLPRVRYVNRQRGAGTRLLLDYELKKRGIPTEQIQGYAHEEYTHLSVAAAIASGVADCGMGVRRAAIALGLEFVPICWERYDFAIPKENLGHEGLQNLLQVLDSAKFKKSLALHPGYDIRESGKVQYDSGVGV